MAQHDYVIDNQTAPNFRADLNQALAAIVSTNSGLSAPSTTYANMLWYDSSNNILKMRNEADDTWINIGTVNQSTNAFEVAGLILGEATWEAGTSTSEAIVSPAKMKAAIEALAPTTNVGTATAALSVGAVGTYAFVSSTTTADYAAGATIAGSNLRYTGLGETVFTPEGQQTEYQVRIWQSGTPSGTWRIMGAIDYSTSENFARSTLALRIS